MLNLTGLLRLLYSSSPLEILFFYPSCLKTTGKGKTGSPREGLREVSLHCQCPSGNEDFNPLFLRETFHHKLKCFAGFSDWGGKKKKRWEERKQHWGVQNNKRKRKKIKLKDDTQKKYRAARRDKMLGIKLGGGKGEFRQNWRKITAAQAKNTGNQRQSIPVLNIN